ncbi:unnamed protein product [Sympodiomycopsis kandeliae]
MTNDIDIPPFAQATAGATASTIANTIVYPLDLISTRVQTSNQKRSKNSPINALREVVRLKGIQGLYQGLGTDNLSNTLSNFLFFFFRAAIVERLHANAEQGKNGDRKPLTPGQDLTSGALAGICSRALTTPLSNITVRKQTHSSGSDKNKSGEKAGNDSDSDDDEQTYEDEPSILDVVNEILKDKGIIGLWSGFETAILLSITPAMTFYLTNIYTRLLVPKSSRSNPNSLQIFLTSALGNATSTTILYPLIIAKTLLQYRDPYGRKIYRNLIDVIVKISRKKGIKGLYKGLESQLLKGIISHGVTMTIKDRVENALVALFILTRRYQRQRLVKS